MVLGLGWAPEKVDDIANKASEEGCQVVDEMVQPRHYAKKVDCTSVAAIP